MASGTLYSYPDNFRAAKALIAAKYSKANVKVCPNFVFGQTNKSKEYLQRFGSSKVPAFEGTDGKCLLDSNAIAYYVSNDQLTGKTAFDKAQVLQWIGFGEAEILPASCAWVFPVLGVIQKDAKADEAFNRAKGDLKAALTVLNQHLLTHTYLVGERITLADISVACNLLPPYKYVLTADYRKGLENVDRWFKTLINQPEFKAVIGEVALCQKEGQAPAQQHQQQQQQSTNEGKKKKDDKKEKKQQQQQPKKEAPKKEKEPEEELDAAEALLAAEPKSKDPLDALPKGTWVMDDFKRFYSNEDEAKSIPYFWEKFDAENYSIWFGEYIYQSELEKVFMSCNLVSGMFQRLDKMRKNAFASVCVFGEDGNNSISGVWVWRGQDLAFKQSPDWSIDYESYNWRKLDAKSEEAKKLVHQYLSWTGTDKDGRKFNQGKIFK